MELTQSCLPQEISFFRKLYRSPIWFCFLLIVLLLTGCPGENGGDWDDIFRDPNTEPVRATVKTAVPLAHVAAVSMAAVQDDPPPQVNSTDTCNSYPCEAFISMEMDPANIPFAYENGGTVLVAGFWASPNQAILTVLFLDVQPGVPFFTVEKVATFPVIATQTPVSGYKIVYADIDINITTEPDDSIDLTNEQIQAEWDRLQTNPTNDPEINVSMDAWVIQLDDNDTPADFTDDTTTISGGGQYIDVNSASSSKSAGIFQLGLVGIRVSHDCSRNPTSGMAFIQEVGTGGDSPLPVVASALLNFTSSCKGTVDVLVAFGNYIPATGSSVELNLDAP